MAQLEDIGITVNSTYVQLNFERENGEESFFKYNIATNDVEIGVLANAVVFSHDEWMANTEMVKSFVSIISKIHSPTGGGISDIKITRNKKSDRYIAKMDSDSGTNYLKVVYRSNNDEFTLDPRPTSFTLSWPDFQEYVMCREDVLDSSSLFS